MLRGYVAPERLDEGINALLLNYSFPAPTPKRAPRRYDRTPTVGYSSVSRPGLNIGPGVAFRNYSTSNRNVNGDSADESWDALHLRPTQYYRAEKSANIRRRTAPSELFDSVPFRGAQPLRR